MRRRRLAALTYTTPPPRLHSQDPFSNLNGRASVLFAAPDDDEPAAAAAGGGGGGGGGFMDSIMAPAPAPSAGGFMDAVMDGGGK